MNDKVRDLIAAYDAAHPYWRQEKREREIKAAKDAEERIRKAHESRRTSRDAAWSN
jgi:hypothetical protein